MIETSTHQPLVVLVGMGLLGLLLAGALILAAVLQHRRFLSACRSFAARLITAQDEERSALARELHDDVVQRIISIAADLRSGEPNRRGSIPNRLDRLADDLRGLARGMHPTVVDHVSLDEALDELARSVEEREGLLVEHHRHGGADDLTPAARLSLYRTAQEALSNAARHAGVDHVRLVVTRTARNLVLEVSDRGRGFDPAAVRGEPGIGLHSMRERLEAMGGSLDVTSRPGKGTRVVATLPLRGGEA